MEVFSGYFMTVKPYIKLFLCFYRVCFASIYIFSDSQNPNAGFSNSSSGYTFYPLSINKVGFFFLSINREKIRLFPSSFMGTNF